MNTDLQNKITKFLFDNGIKSDIVDGQLIVSRDFMMESRFSCKGMLEESVYANTLKELNNICSEDAILYWSGKNDDYLFLDAIPI